MNDILKILLTDWAIICYELIAIGLLIFFIVRQNKIKKVFLRQKEKESLEKSELEFNELLINKNQKQ